MEMFVDKVRITVCGGRGGDGLGRNGEGGGGRATVATNAGNRDGGLTGCAVTRVAYRVVHALRQSRTGQQHNRHHRLMLGAIVNKLHLGQGQGGTCKAIGRNGEGLGYAAGVVAASLVSM